MRCDECYWCKYTPMVIRGAVYADPPEWDCKKEMYDWFLMEDDELIDTFTEEEIENGCPCFSFYCWDDDL